MTAEKATLQRVQAGLFHLRKDLTPFVEAHEGPSRRGLASLRKSRTGQNLGDRAR